MTHFQQVHSDYIEIGETVWRDLPNLTAKRCPALTLTRILQLTEMAILLPCVPEML